MTTPGTDVRRNERASGRSAALEYPLAPVRPLEQQDPRYDHPDRGDPGDDVDHPVERLAVADREEREDCRDRSHDHGGEAEQDQRDGLQYPALPRLGDRG